MDNVLLIIVLISMILFFLFTAWLGRCQMSHFYNASSLHLQRFDFHPFIQTSPQPFWGFSVSPSSSWWAFSATWQGPWVALLEAMTSVLPGFPWYESLFHKFYFRFANCAGQKHAMENDGQGNNMVSLVQCLLSPPISGCHDFLWGKIYLSIRVLC